MTVTLHSDGWVIATAIGTIGLALVAALGLWLSRRATAAAEQATRVAEAAIEHQRALAGDCCGIG